MLTGSSQGSIGAVAGEKNSPWRVSGTGCNMRTEWGNTNMPYPIDIPRNAAKCE